MKKNRYFKTTMGYFAELAIVSKVDASDGTGAAAVPATVSIPVTIAADPTPGDLITITIDGTPYTHTVPVGDETTQEAHDAIAAMLAENSQGFTLVSHTGTTSSVFNLAWSGADKNGKAVTLAETGTTFTAAGPYTFAGGTNGDATAADDYETFVASGQTSSIWAFFSEPDAAGKQVALVAGDTANPANKDKHFFYAWKDIDGEVKRSTDIPIDGYKIKTQAYDAGAFDVWDITFGGTYSATQILHVRVLDTTSTDLPYPSYDYSAVIGSGGINAAVTAIRDQINAEKNAKIVTAAASTNVLTVTADAKNTTVKVVTYVETSPSQVTDASAPAIVHTTKAKAPIGDVAYVQELYEYYKLNRGAVNYGPGQTSGQEFGWPAQDITAISQYGIALVTSKREEPGIVRNYPHTAYIVIATATADVAALAAL